MSPKNVAMDEACSLYYLPKMVEKFEQACGHEMGNRKTHNEKSNTLAYR
jgi:hypothetical protein